MPDVAEETAVATVSSEVLDGVTLTVQSDAQTIATLEAKLAKVTDHERRIMERREKCRESEAFWERKKDEAAEAKKAHDANVERLMDEIDRRDGQGVLAFGDQVDENTEQAKLPFVEDEASKIPLKDIALTKAQVKKLDERECRTVGDLEALIHSGRFVHGELEGIDEKMVNAVREKLAVFREKNQARAPADDGLIDGQWLPTEFKAGQLAKEGGLSDSMNPWQPGTHQFNSWKQGWWKEPEASQTVEEAGKVPV